MVKGYNIILLKGSYRTSLHAIILNMNYSNAMRPWTYFQLHPIKILQYDTYDFMSFLTNYGYHISREECAVGPIYCYICSCFSMRQDSFEYCSGELPKHRPFSP